MEMLAKLKNFFDHPTETKMHALCITGIVCVAVCMVDWLLSLGSSVLFCLEHSYWNYFFRDSFINDLPNNLLLVALLLTFIHWLQGKRFRFQLAVPIIWLCIFLISIYSFTSTWILPGRSFVDHPIWVMLSFLVTVFMTICLAFFIFEMIKPKNHHIALFMSIPITLNTLIMLINHILSILSLKTSWGTFLSLFPIIFMRVAWLLFCTGWYMKQKEPNI